MSQNQILQLEETADGSHTLYVPGMNEHYHSVNGAIQESLHIYINSGFNYNITKNNLSVLEIGFGTGLNAYLTLLKSQNTDTLVEYTTVELYPLGASLIEKINYPEILNLDRTLFEKIHQAQWENPQNITPNFLLNKKELDITTQYALLNNKLFDVIYYDAFAPDKQPEVWTQSIFDFLYENTSPDGVLVTYCSKGVVKRMLQQAGYKIQKLEGPIGKREIIRAIK